MNPDETQEEYIRRVKRMKWYLHQLPDYRKQCYGDDKG